MNSMFGQKCLKRRRYSVHRGAGFKQESLLFLGDRSYLGKEKEGVFYSESSTMTRI